MKVVLLCSLLGLSVSAPMPKSIIEFMNQKKFQVSSSVDNDANKSVKEIVTENNYIYEEYTVVTQDDYILSLYRIPALASESVPYAPKPAVLLQHGLESDASQWVINSPDLAQAFILANAGYDVWMGNNRGCVYSLGHKTLDSSDKDDKPLYWNFSFEEMGLYDLPAEIDFILETTGQQNLSYIGHSEGTTQMFIALTMNYEYIKEKVNLFIALAPIARLDHTMSDLLKLIAKFETPIEWVLVDLLGMYDLFPPGFIDNELTADFCAIFTPICDAMLELFCDLDTDVDNMDRVRTYLTHIPAGACYKNFMHYGQILNDKQFQRYDYGKTQNHKVYGQDSPPAYDLSKIVDFPIALFGGSLDELGDPTDVQWLNDILASQNSVIFYNTYYLGHMSFSIAKDMSWFSVDAMYILNQYATNNQAASTQFIQ